MLAYTVYTLTARESQALAATIPFVVFGIFRYLLLLHRGGKGEEPENVLVDATSRSSPRSARGPPPARRSSP